MFSILPGVCREALRAHQLLPRHRPLDNVMCESGCQQLAMRGVIPGKNRPTTAGACQCPQLADIMLQVSTSRSCQQSACSSQHKCINQYTLMSAKDAALAIWLGDKDRYWSSPVEKAVDGRALWAMLARARHSMRGLPPVNCTSELTFPGTF